MTVHRGSSSRFGDVLMENSLISVLFGSHFRAWGLIFIVSGVPVEDAMMVEELLMILTSPWRRHVSDLNCEKSQKLGSGTALTAAESLGYRLLAEATNPSPSSSSVTVSPSVQKENSCYLF